MQYESDTQKLKDAVEGYFLREMNIKVHFIDVRSLNKQSLMFGVVLEGTDEAIVAPRPRIEYPGHYVDLYFASIKPEGSSRNHGRVDKIVKLARVKTKKDGAGEFILDEVINKGIVELEN